jgi:hypothetical protein
LLHLAVFSPGYINKIFTGQKTHDGRFSKIRCRPFRTVSRGDLILMKQSGGSMRGYFVAGDVEDFEKVDEGIFDYVLEKYGNSLTLTQDFIDLKSNSTNYITIIEITKPTRFRNPVGIKKHDRSGWVTLGGESQKQIELF